MKAHKITILVIDFDELGAEEAKSVLENAHYPNHCMSPDVMDIQTVDLGEWTDEHPLNNSETRQAEYERLFAEPRPEPSGKDGEYIQCPHCGGGAFREGIAYTCTRCAMVTAIEPKVEPPLNTPEKLYRDLLNHLGCNGHDGALAEIEALRRHAGLADTASADLAEWDAVSVSAWDIGEPAVAIPEPAQPYQPRTEFVRQLLEIRARILAAGYPPLTLDEINGEAAPRAPEARTCATCAHWDKTEWGNVKHDWGNCHCDELYQQTGNRSYYLRVNENFGCIHHQPRPATGQERKP